MYKSFYFLHLDKTISINIDASWMTALYQVLERNGINVDLNKQHYNHNFWREFDDETYIFSVIRDPAARACSDFCHLMLYDDFNLFKGKEDLYTLRHDLNRTPENLQHWLDTIHTPNYQTRAICENNVSVLQERLDRINLLVKTEDFGKDNQLNLFNKILSDFGIPPVESAPLITGATAWFGHVGDIFYQNEIWGTELHSQIVEKNRSDWDLWASINN